MGAIAYIIDFARHLFFDEDPPKVTHLEKIDNYAELIVPNFNDRQFKENFRICPETFEDLLIKIHNVELQQHHRGHPELDIEKQLMIAIWYIGNVESLRSVAERFGIYKSSCWDILYRTCGKLLRVNTMYAIISWPTIPRALAIMQDFGRINNFPGIIGAIDGSHIPIIKPREHPNSYINRKSFPSVLLQAVCDNKTLFLDVYAGEPSSIHDARLFTKSDLYTRIINNQVAFPNDGHLIGDLAYKLAPYLMVGFKNIGFLTPQQRVYNYKLSQNRVVIEVAFAFLKGRFRRLKLMKTIRLDLISLLIVTACILHNVCCLTGDAPEEIVELKGELRNNGPQNVQ